LEDFAMRYWKYGVAAIAGVMWIAGLVDQFDSLELTARYVGLSLALVAVATV
jgi:hypothetical protein